VSSPDHRSHLKTAEILAALSRISVRDGDAALARVRLQECLGEIGADGSQRAMGAALHAIAALAEAVGDSEHAVEFYCACRRILGRIAAEARPAGSEERAAALSRLRADLGDVRFETAWAAAQRTPYPVEFYLDRAGRWLDELGRLHGDAAPPGRDATSSPGGDQMPGTTEVLITQAAVGSETARDRLAERHLEPLRRFGHGRLPAHARDLHDTDDLVQISVERGLDHIDLLQSKRKGGFFAYLRTIFMNLVRDEVRRSSRRPKRVHLTEAVASPRPSPLEEMVGREAFSSYQVALSGIPEKKRRALELRIEEGLSYQTIADELGFPSADAARMLVGRALKELTKRMRSTGGR
jgi:RNA polymerase sigma factor (sigma-70 family)